MRRRWLLLAAAPLAACSGGSSDAGTAPTVNEGPPASVEIPAAPATTVPGTPSFPRAAVAVTTDGRLVVLDTSSQQAAEIRQLAPTADAVAVTPDGATAYFSADGVWRVPTDGTTPPERLGDGSLPRVSPDGGRLAYRGVDGVVVRDVTTGAELSVAGAGIIDLSWTADGTGLLFTVPTEDGSELMWIDLDEADTGPVVLVSLPAAGGDLRLPLGSVHGGQVTVLTQSDGAQMVVVDRQNGTVMTSPEPEPAVVLDRQYDASGSWGLRVYVDGTLAWSGGGGAGWMGVCYLAADW